MEIDHVAPQNESLVLLGEREPGFQLWEFQTRLLACQFGLFSGDMRLRREARLSFCRLHMLCQEARLEAKMIDSDDWPQWIFSESISRCVAWVNILSAVLMCEADMPTFQASVPYIDGPLPCPERQWMASRRNWSDWPKVYITLSSAFKLLVAGAPIDSRTSPFGLLTLISVLLVQICALRREPQKVHAALVEETKVQTALATWEEAWKAHPHLTKLPEAPHGPLMADSILILNTAYYRLYAREQLDVLNALARMPSVPITTDSIDHLYNLYSHPGLVKALVRACRSLLIRVRLGIRHLGKTASLSYACYGPLPAYDGSLLIAWHCLGQRLSKFQVTDDPMITTMMDEIVLESEYLYGAPIQREVIAMTLYRDLIRERWIWHSCNLIADRLDGMIQQFQLFLERQGLK